MQMPLDSITLITIISLFNLGFFGGFSHCIGMCGPFVLTQVTNKLVKTPLEEYRGLRKLQNLALLPYHFGRITTYSFIGFCCSFLTGNLADFVIFKEISAIFLFIAAGIFLGLVMKNLKSSSIFRKINYPISFVAKLSWRKNQNGPRNKCGVTRLDRTRAVTPHLLQGPCNYHAFTGLKILWHGVESRVKKLFADPQGFNGYLLGLILGFIPCGLLYGAFILAASIQNPFFAVIGMFAFGLATVPALFTSAIFSGFFFCKIIKPKLEFAANLVLLVNAVALFLMALSLISK